MTKTARQCAAEILGAVLGEKRPLDEAFARHPQLASLEERDRAFAWLMVLTVLRRKGQIDVLLTQMLEKPLTGRTQDVMQCLRLGVVQLLWLQTPAHAAVNAMVETVGEMGHERMKGVANAVLKRVAREGAEIVAGQDEAILGLSDWMIASWKEAYGEKTAHAIAQARFAEPPLDLTVKQDAAHWAQMLGGQVLPTGSVRLEQAGKVDRLAGFEQGAWWVQDTAASLPVKLLGDVRGLDVLDLCAAPGGKTAQLLAGGAQVTSVDKSARRLALLRTNLERLGFVADLVEADILKFKPDRLFDAILLDAPCSATGTFRRHPDVLLHKSKDDVEELANLQRKLLARVSNWVKPGGKLVYCVCSLQPQEGEKQAENFMASHPEFEIQPAPAEWASLGITLPDGALRTHPAQFTAAGGLDGFYAICWNRLKVI